MNAADGLPAFRVMQKALRVITERLASELREPRQTAPDWNELEWRLARAVAIMQGTSGLLATRLLWQGPPQWHAFLHAQRSQMAAIQEKARRRLERLDDALRAAGVACVPLKGAALLSLGLLERGARSMGDIDLLVRPRDLASVAAALCSLGYTPELETHRHRSFLPPRGTATAVAAEHRHNPLRVEVHERIAEELPLEEVDITAGLWPSQARPGSNAYASIASLMRHLLLHIAGNIRARTLRQVQLHDIAALAQRMTPADWRRLFAGGTTWWLYPPLCFAARYVPESIPPRVLTLARAACPRLLRSRCGRQSLTDVSWANARVEALPGIEWSRTPLQALRYARSRALPGRRLRSELEQTARTQPQVRSAAWYQVSQTRRILRWLSGPVPRAHTLLAVRAALDAAVDG
jgi:hypothetical protein